VRFRAWRLRLLLYEPYPAAGTITSGSQRSREGYLVISSTKEGAGVRRNRMRAAITTATAIAAVAAFAGPASANLSAVGPTAPNGFPAYFEDSTPLQVGLCINDLGCPASPPVLEDVINHDEAFYQLAGGTVTGKSGDDLPNANVTVDFNVEAAFLSGKPITFSRIQFKAEGLRGNTTYTVEHPYGTSHFTTEPDGTLLGGKASAQREETDGTFGDTLNSPIGPFLRSTSAPTGYLGNGTTPTTVTGGSVRNTLRVFGPGLPPAVTDALGQIITPEGLMTDEFLVEGKLFDPTAPLPPAPVPVPPDTDKDGVIDSVDLCVNQQGPAINNGCPLPIIVDKTKPTAPTQTQTIIQVIRDPAQQVLGKQVSSLAVSRLSLAHRISISRLRVQGLRASMQVKEGTRVVRLAIYKARGGQRSGRALFTTTRTPRSGGLFRVTLRNRSLLSKLRAGSYVLQVRSGSSASSLSGVRQIVFTVTK
jgi:hypothetical protein